MEFISVTPTYSVVIRQDALQKHQIDTPQLTTAMEATSFFSQNRALIAFGPHFGMEAAEALMKNLERLGLTYFDDFFVFYGDFPEWAKFGVQLKGEFNE